MNRFLEFIAIATLSLATTVSARQSWGESHTLGLKVGMNQSGVIGSDVDLLMNEVSAGTGLFTSNKLKTGFACGVFLNTQVSKRFAVQLELLYSRKGFRISMRAPEGITYIKFANDYFEIPLLFKFMIGRQSAKPCLFAGPALGLRLKSTFESDTASEDAANLWKRGDLGLVFGGGLDFPAGQATLMIDCRYNLGLTKIPDDGPENIDIKNSNFSLMLGCGF